MAKTWDGSIHAARSERSTMGSSQPVLVVENDVWARLIGVVLDPTTRPERWAAFADFMSPDLPDFKGWCDQVRKRAPSLYPSEVRLVASRSELQSSPWRPISRSYTNTARSFAISMWRRAKRAASRFWACAGVPTLPAP